MTEKENRLTSALHRLVAKRQYRCEHPLQSRMNIENNLQYCGDCSRTEEKGDETVWHSPSAETIETLQEWDKRERKAGRPIENESYRV